MNFLRKLVRGDISLPLTFWVGFFLLRILLATIVFYAQRYTPGLPARLVAGIFLLYDITIMIATWRSAGTYVAHHANSMKRLWGYAARLAVAAMIAMILAQLFSVAPKLLHNAALPETEAHMIIHGDPAQDPITE